MVNTLCIIQARLTSTRLPNKVLMPLGDTGISLLEHTYQRLKVVRNIDQVVFAIPDTKENDKLEEFLKSKGINSFRGDEDNVLKRFYECAMKYHPNIVVRATCDNPCVDFEEAARLIDALTGYDYAATANAPLGTAVEAFKFEALYRAYNEAKSDIEKEHVTPYLYRHEEIFKVLRLPYSNIQPIKLRLTVDTEKDLELVNHIYSALYKGDVFSNELIYNYLAKNPRLLDLNSEVQQKTI